MLVAYIGNYRPNCSSMFLTVDVLMFWWINLTRRLWFNRSPAEYTQWSWFIISQVIISYLENKQTKETCALFYTFSSEASA